MCVGLNKRSSSRILVPVRLNLENSKEISFMKNVSWLVPINEAVVPGLIKLEF